MELTEFQKRRRDKLDDIAEKLNLSKEEKEKALRVIELAEEEKIVIGKSTKTIVAASVLISTDHKQVDVRRAGDLTEAGLRQIKKQLLEIDSINEFLKNYEE